MNLRLRAPSPLGFADRIRALTQAFTDGVLTAAKRASLQELVEAQEPSRAAPPPRAAGRPAARASSRTRPRAKRSPEKIASLVDRIVRIVERTPLGLSAGELREQLHLDRSAFMRPIQEAVATGRIAVQGERRLTVYVRRLLRRSRREPKGRQRGRARAAAAPRRSPRRPSRRSGAPRTRNRPQSPKTKTPWLRTRPPKTRRPATL